MKSLFAIIFLVSIGVHAAPETTSTEGSGSQFELDKGLVDEIYKDSVGKTATEYRPISRGILVSPQISFVNASQLSLSNNYWEVPYAEQLGGVPAFSLQLSNAIFTVGGLSISAKGSVGYSYKESVISVVSKQTGNSSRAVMTLHWLPLSLGTRIEYRIASIDIVRPHLDIEGGAQWLYQSGKLDGIEQGFWVPFYQASLGLTLFGSSLNQGDWFGGLNLGGTIRNSFASQQNIRTWSLDVGVNLYL